MYMLLSPVERENATAVTSGLFCIDEVSRKFTYVSRGAFSGADIAAD
jgi:hypothetical protein